MKKHLKPLLFLLFSAFTSVSAQAQALPFSIEQPGDADMGCGRLSQEVAAMNEMIRQARDVQENTDMAITGVGVAKTVGSFLIGSVGGAIGIMAAGQLVRSATDDRAEDASSLEDAAGMRRSMMVGIYNAKKCQGPLHPGIDEIEQAATANGAIEPAAGTTSQQPPVWRHPEKIQYNN